MNELDYTPDHITALTSLRAHLQDAKYLALDLGMSSTASVLDGQVDAIDYVLGKIEEDRIEEENMWIHERHGY